MMTMADTLKRRNAETEKKQIPLRLSPSLVSELSAWAADEFRSLNGQIEYLLTECVKQNDGVATTAKNPTACLENNIKWRTAWKKS